MHHHHHHTHNKNALFISFIIISIFVMVELVGGILTNSLALLSDAGHMFSDAISLGVGLLAIKIGELITSENKTFGYKRIEVLAALFNGLLLIFISIAIFWEALHRFSEPHIIAGKGMLIIAIIGALVNIGVLLILKDTHHHGNINMQAAMLHVVGDLLGSIGAIIASLLIIFYGWTLADPIASMVVALIIIKSGFSVTYDAVHILMEGKPNDLDLEEIRKKLLQIPGVVGIHDFHAWSITSDFPTISCHILISSKNHDEVLTEALRELHDTYHIEHATIQVESVNANVDQYEHHRCN
ncbi:cation diffusion facilitator family transporter [Ureibacillus sp. MALMAid1270]|uniref:cation diffusion facilitator family transporter n=1 Tax=Ureibacillus sp. MALMAid1270 TaxID=3411629 RepID=UPI003BA5FC83